VVSDCVHKIRDADDWVEISRREYALLLECEEVVRLVAVGRRPDGTYNLSREACEQLAQEALAKRGGP
jgi:hypothetical protein